MGDISRLSNRAANVLRNAGIRRGKLYGQWLVGCAVMVFDFANFDPKQLCTIVNTYGVTSFCAPPTVYRYLARKGIPDMPSPPHASTAGETLNPEISRRFTECTGLPL